MPPLNGGWPAIWMQNIGATLDYTGTSPTTKNYAELDIIEGNSANISTAQAYSSSIHDWYCTGSSCTVSDLDNNNSSNTVSIGSTNMSNFHTWGVLVTTTGVYWYLDGALVNTALCSAHANFCAAAQASPMYLMLSDQVGTNWGNTGVAYPSTSATLNVQWVHVWK
jgi:beta-glucanase (GH16 family)